MKDEDVYSCIHDEKLSQNLSLSPMWKKAFKLEELTPQVKAMSPVWIKYTIRFDGLTPIILLKTEIL
jgi:hypothetical protein